MLAHEKCLYELIDFFFFFEKLYKSILYMDSYTFIYIYTQVCVWIHILLYIWIHTIICTLNYLNRG